MKSYEQTTDTVLLRRNKHIKKIKKIQHFSAAAAIFIIICTVTLGTLSLKNKNEISPDKSPENQEAPVVSDTPSTSDEVITNEPVSDAPDEGVTQSEDTPVAGDTTDTSEDDMVISMSSASIAYRPTAEIIESADLILVARVTGETNTVKPDKAIAPEGCFEVYTDHTMEVISAAKGEASGKITVRSPGGKIDNEHWFSVSIAPNLESDKYYFIFLVKDEKPLVENDIEVYRCIPLECHEIDENGEIEVCGMYDEDTQAMNDIYTKVKADAIAAIKKVQE